MTIKHIARIALFAAILGVSFPKMGYSQLWTNSTQTDNTVHGGNVGIGLSTTTAPSSRLHVLTSTGNGFQLDHNVTTAYGYAATINVQHDQTKAFTIQRVSGGIGTPVFQVWGNGVVNASTIYATALVITPTAIGNGYPDYVFNKNYKLKTIYELEAYIKKEHHLPNVPSAAFVKENGVNVYELNKALLEKVEELSLYIISLKKEIDEMKNQTN